MSSIAGIQPALGVLRVGELARAALERSGGRASVLPELPEGPYYRAEGELLWVGARLPAMHPRAVVTADPRPSVPELRFGPRPARGWSAELPATPDARALASGAARLREALLGAEAPRGFGTLLAGRPSQFPLSLGVAGVRALAAACARDDAAAARAAAQPLLGFGTGLTPAGDDLVGAALFARRMLAAGEPRWEAVALALASEASTRSHPVSAALFGDLARGRSFAPLHSAAEALARGDESGALAAARQLAAIGHSSGWDMLTGFLLGIGLGLPD
jgi:hypothetical protein